MSEKVILGKYTPDPSFDHAAMVAKRADKVRAHFEDVVAQIDAIKKNNVDNLTQYSMIEVLNAALPQKKLNGKLTFSKRKLDRFFTADYDNEEREKVILQLLEKWKESGENGI